jgi:hypothetical protein
LARLADNDYAAVPINDAEEAEKGDNRGGAEARFCRADDLGTQA